MEYYETDNINEKELFASWRMSTFEKNKYIMDSRKGNHLFMPTYESFNNIMDEDEKKLRLLLTLNDKYFVIKDEDKIIGVATIIGGKELTYVVPFKYQRKVMIIPIIREIMSKYNIKKTVRIEDLGKEIMSELPKQESNCYEDEMNIIKRTIDILINNGYNKDDILSEIIGYVDIKTYQKK